MKSSSGERASSACDSACAGSHQAAALSTYPGYVGDYAVIGVATVAEVRGNTDTIAVSGTLSGLEPSASRRRVAHEEKVSQRQGEAGPDSSE